MRVLHLSTADNGGGAARAAFRLHTGLRRLGVESNMLVLKRTSGDANVRQIAWATDPITRFRRKRRAKRIRRDFAACKPSLPADFEIFSDDRSEAGYDLIRQLPPCDLINLHWVGGFLDHDLFFSNLPKNVPLVWRMADMNAFTGGCHYDLGCGKFMNCCGACPVLGSSDEQDLSRQVWKGKFAALSKVPTDRLHVVGTSRWIRAQAKESSLLARFPSSVIPNGLDTEDFAPRDKLFSRDTLGVPREARVVLFVAESAANRRKGFEFVNRALAGLTDAPNLFLLSVGGGKPDVPGIPQLHLGRISNDRMLSIIYSAADVFVMPSLQESFGQTVTESMACGTPVVGFDTGGIPDMVRPGITGYLAPPADAEGLRREILRLLDDPVKRLEMSGNCRRIAVAEYSFLVQAEAYRKLYETLIAARA
jgi:glycosyltransferase involved in cell wall biosynthesis